jgi:hypothetical protein
VSAAGPGSGASALNGREEHGDARLLISDIRVALLLLRQARHAVVVRLFGVDQDDSLLISIIALAAVARAARDLTSGVVVTPARPSVGDSMIGASVLRESAHWLSGDRYRDTPVFGTLVAFAFLAAAATPVVRGSVRGVKNASHRARSGFDQRYGHLVRLRAAGGR